MRVDLRVKHDVEARKAAIGLFELGHGCKSAAIALSLPAEAVRRWQEIYRAFGSEVLLRMDGKQGRYTYEQKVAAASAVVDGGMTKTEAMAAFGIMSMSPLKKWCALYRRGGAEALRPRPKGRPSGSRARPRTREEELEERCRVSVNLFFTSFAKQAHRSRKGGFTGCANAFSPIPVTA